MHGAHAGLICTGHSKNGNKCDDNDVVHNRDSSVYLTDCQIECALYIYMAEYVVCDNKNYLLGKFE